MRAHDLATPYPSLTPDAPAEEVARQLAAEAMEGVFVQDEHGDLQGCVSDTTLLAFLLPRYLAEDGPGRHARRGRRWRPVQRLRGRTIRDLLPAEAAGLLHGLVRHGRGPDQDRRRRRAGRMLVCVPYLWLRYFALG